MKRLGLSLTLFILPYFFLGYSAAWGASFAGCEFGYEMACSIYDSFTWDYTAYTIHPF